MQFAALACGLCMALSAETITTVSQVRALADEDYSRTIPFCLTGLVTKITRKGCLLDAADGSCALLGSNIIFNTSDVIRVDGYTRIGNFSNDPILQSTNILHLGRAPVPEPTLLSLEELLAGKGDYKRIRIRGFITDAFNDNIDDNFVIAQLNVQGRILHTATLNTGTVLDSLRSLIDADIELTGTCIPWVGGKRLFGGPLIRFDSASADIKILSIGNSYSADALSYVPFILENMNVNVNIQIGILIMGGATLSDHLENFEHQTANYNYYF